MDLRSIGVANASIIVDRSAPVPGNVYDGETAGQDLMYTKDQDKVIKKSHWILFKNFMHTVKVKDFFDLYVFLSISLTSHLTFEQCQPYTTWRIHCLLTKVKGIYYLSCSFFYRDIFTHFYFLYFFYVQICANWEGFSDAESGIALYIVNVWTSDSGVTTKVVNDTQFSRTTSSACFDLAAGNHLQHGKMYYVTVQAFNSANKQLNVSATSDGGKFYKTYMKSHGKAFLFFYEVPVVKKNIHNLSEICTVNASDI